MTRSLTTFSPETPIREAIEVLCTEHLSGAPVVSGARVVGVVSMTDLLSFIVTTRDRDRDRNENETFSSDWEDRAEEPEDENIQELAGGDEILDEWAEDTDALLDKTEPDLGGLLDQHVVEEVMTTEVVSLPSTARVSAAASLMEKRDIHRVLVIDGGRLEGIVSSLDIARDFTRRAAKTA
jgi:CBS domain-containing protein